MKIVGNSYPIHDARAKVTGGAIYAGDMLLPGMLHAAMLFSPIPHGFVKAVDDAVARAVPGVVDVLHPFNTTEKMFCRYRTIKDQALPDQERVFNDHVRFVGDRVACVLAETPEIAKKAVRLLKVTYEERPFTCDPQEVLAGEIADLHPQGAVYGDFTAEVGDRNAVDPDAVETVTQTHMSRVNHVAMEPHACVAYYDRGMDELTIWSPNQAIFGIRTVIGDLFGLPYHRVRVIKATMGGSFGGKQEWMLEPVAAAATLKTGKPVKLVYTRSATFTSTISRSPIDATFTSKVTKDGFLQSIEADVTLDAGAYLGNSYDYIGALSKKFFRCYQYPYLNYRARAVCTNSPVSGAFRGWSAPELYIMLEHNLNMAARKIGMDPMELRLKNVARPGDRDMILDIPMGEIRARECIELGRDKFRWAEKKKENEAFNAKNERYQRGVGIGCGGHLNGYFPRLQDFTGVEMRMTESGSVIVNITLHDHGCGSVTAFQMIVAEEMGLPVDMISIREGDTAYSPLDYGCFSSRTTYVLGRAAADCAKKLKARMLEGIAAIHGVLPDDLEIRDAEVVSRDGGAIRYSYGDAAVKMFRTLQKECWVKHQYVNATNPGVTAAHFAHVEVDTYTGMVKILEYLAVHDIGQAINRGICIGQVQGAVVMGSGAALAEHADVNPATGRPTSSLKDYHVINAPELPHIQVEFIEDGGTEGPNGAKSIGEVAHVPVAPTIAGAVNDALQSDLGVLPLNPDTIIALMQARQTGRAGR